MPQPGLTTGSQVSDFATVVFDANPPISTPAWTNTIDNTAPMSQVAPLPPTEPQPTFTLNWSGTDIGAGIQGYTIYVSDNGGPYSVFLTNTSLLSASFAGQPGHAYGFFSIATDLVGNVEPLKTTADTTTMVVNNPTTYTISGNISLAGGAGLPSVAVSVTGSATASTTTDVSRNYSLTLAGGGSYVITPALGGYSFTPANANVPALSANQSANFTASPTSVNYTISGQALGPAGTPLVDVTVNLNGSASASTLTDSSGSYSFSVAAGGPYTLTPSLSGFYFYPYPPSVTINTVNANQTINFRGPFQQILTTTGIPT
jgi:hypothetical protein